MFRFATQYDVYAMAIPLPEVGKNFTNSCRFGLPKFDQLIPKTLDFASQIAVWLRQRVVVLKGYRLVQFAQREFNITASCRVNSLRRESGGRFRISLDLFQPFSCRGPAGRFFTPRRFCGDRRLATSKSLKIQIAGAKIGLPFAATPCFLGIAQNLQQLVDHCHALIPQQDLNGQSQLTEGLWYKTAVQAASVVANVVPNAVPFFPFLLGIPLGVGAKRTEPFLEKLVRRLDHFPTDSVHPTTRVRDCSGCGNRFGSRIRPQHVLGSQPIASDASEDRSD